MHPFSDFSNLSCKKLHLVTVCSVGSAQLILDILTREVGFHGSDVTCIILERLLTTLDTIEACDVFPGGPKLRLSRIARTPILLTADSTFQKLKACFLHTQAPKPEPTPKMEPKLSDEQQLQEYTKQRDELNRNIEQLRAKLADQAEVAALRKQLEQLQGQFAEEQKLRTNLEGAYQVGARRFCLLQSTSFDTMIVRL